MTPGTWAALTTANINQELGNTGGSSGTVITYFDSMPWDPNSLSLWFVAGDHNQTVNPNKFHRYNAITNAWQGMGTPSFASFIQYHGYDHNAIDPATGDLYHREFGSNNSHVQRYRQATGTWGALPDIPFGDYISDSSGTAYFPEAGGYVVANGGGGSGFLYLFNTVTQQWEKLASNLVMGNYGNFAEYNPVHKVTVFGGGQGSPAVWKVNASRQVTRMQDAPIGLGVNGTMFTVDPVSGDYLVFQGSSHAFYKYNVLTDTWTLLNGAGAPIWTTAYGNSVNGMAAASIPTYGVNLFVSCDYGNCRVNLYKHSGGNPPPPPPTDTTPPTVSITAPTAGATVSGTITVSANASDNVGVVGVQFKLNGANLQAEDTTAPYAISWNTTTVANGSYTITATARDAAGNQATSAGVTVTVSNGGADTTPPSTPTGLGAIAVSSSQINLAWTASTDNVGVTGYRIYRGGVQIATANTTSYQDAGLSASTTYSYRVAAYDAAGNVSAQSGSATATTQAPPPPDTTPPSVPTGLSATAISSSQINLSWTASSDNVGVTGYKVYRCQGSGCTPSIQIATSTMTSYSDIGLSASITYTYRVAAYDVAGNVSGQSASASATTPAGTPTVVGGYPMPSVQDEKNTYTQWGWTWTASQEPSAVTEIINNYTIDDPDIHGDTEGDDLWSYLQMYRRSGNTVYLNRAQAWLNYFKNEYKQCVGTYGYSFCYDKDSYGMDHMYGWGLIALYEYTGDTAALAAAENLGAELENYWYPRLAAEPPGQYPISFYGMRQGARHLLLATRLAEVTKNQRWITLRDTLIDVFLKSPDWDPRGMYFVGDWSTDVTLWPGAYAAGARIQGALHIGILAEAFAHAYRTTGNAEIKNRLIAMARFVDQYGLHAVYQYTGSTFGIVNGKAWHNYFDESPTVTFADSVYTTSLVNTLAWGGKLAGDQGLTNRAKYFFNRGTKGVYGSPTLRACSDTQVCHFVDTKFFYNYLDNNKGELQYTYLLFENSGAPSDTTPPIVAITTPTTASTYSTSTSPLTLGGTAADNVGVTQVTWSNDRGGSGTAAGTTTWTASGIALQSGTNVLTVTARDAAGNTGTKTLTVTYTPPDTTPPTTNIIGGPSGTITVNSATFTWVGADNVTPIASLVYAFRLNPLEPSFSAFGPATSKTYTNLANGSYTFFVKAKDQAGNEDPTPASQGFTVNVGSVDTTPPSTPTGVTATALSSSQINLSWSASTDNVGVTGYRIFRGGTQIATSTTTSYSDTGLSPSTAYTYTVAAYDAAGNVSAQSVPVSATTQTASGRILQVGPGKPLAKPSQAAAIALDGDIVEIDAGLYLGDVAVWYANNLTLRGVGGRAHLAANGNYAMGKGIWVIVGDNATVENIEFSGATVPDQNGAGIRLDGSGITIRNCYFHDNEEGILGGDGATSDILIENSEFARNGFGDGQSHNIYIGEARSFTLRYSYSHHAKIGHQVKSRAHTNYILYNRIMDENTGNGSYEIDLPWGGLSYVIGNLIQKGSNADNSSLVAYAAEGAVNPVQELYVVNNSMVSDYPAGGAFVQVSGAPVVKVLNNIFVGGGQVLTGGSGTLSNNLVGQNPLFVDRANFDYHLVAGSPAIDGGTNPGSANGFNLTPTFQYLHPASAEPRPAINTLDIGAYEFGSTGPPDTTPPTVAITTPTTAATYSTGSSPLSLGGTAADNVGVTQVTWSNDRGGSGTAAGTTSWTASGIVLQAGTNVLTVAAQDAAGNTGSKTLTVTYTPPDTTPPTTNITGGPSGTITVNSTTFTWIGSDNVTPVASLIYAFRLDPLEPTFSAFGPATSKTYTNLANGSYTFFVKAKDQAGNEDSTPASQSFTVNAVSVDTTPPTVAITTPTTASTYSTGSSPLSLGGTAADNVGVTQVTWSNDRGGSGTAAGTTSWTASGVALQPGTNILTVTARDAAGNTGSKTLTVSYTPPDTTPPSTTLLTGGASGPTTVNSAAFTITVNSITFNWVGADNITPVGSLVYAFRLHPLEPSFSAFGSATSKTYTGLANGPYIFYVKAKDQAGNEDPTPASQSFTVSVPDTTPPTVAITVPTPNPTYDTSSTPVTLGGTAADNVGLTQVTWANDRGGSGTATGTTSWTASGITLKSGTNVLTVTARDAAGNTGTKSLTVKRHPKTSITGGPTGTVTATSATFTWTDSYSDAQGAGFLYAYRLAPLEPSFSAFGRATSRTYTGLANSSYTFYVKAKDKWGNEDLVPTSQSFTVNMVSVDTTPPTVAITTPTTASTFSTKSSPLTLGGTAADNVGVTQVTWSNDRGGSGTAAGTTSWTASGIALQAGTNILTVTARDAAGNTGTKTLTVTYTPTNHPPAATLIAPSGTTATATPTFTWNAVPTATSYHLWVNDSTGPKFTQWLGPATVGCAAGTGTCSFTPSTALPPGAARWWIQTWNPAGYGPWSAPMDFTTLSPPGSATLIAPAGPISTTKPTYTWNAVAAATSYQLWVNDSTGPKFQQWVKPATVGCAAGTGTCSFTPSTALAPGAARWWIQTWNLGGYGPWSAPRDFTVP